MNRIIKKAILVGLGATILTKEKLEKVVKYLIKKGTVTAKEGKEVMTTLLKEAKKDKNKIEKETKRLAKEAESIMRKEVKILKKRLAKLEKKAKSKK